MVIKMNTIFEQLNIILAKLIFTLGLLSQVIIPAADIPLGAMVESEVVNKYAIGIIVNTENLSEILKIESAMRGLDSLIIYKDVQTNYGTTTKRFININGVEYPVQFYAAYASEEFAEKLKGKIDAWKVYFNEPTNEVHYYNWLVKRAIDQGADRIIIIPHTVLLTQIDLDNMEFLKSFNNDGTKILIKKDLFQKYGQFEETNITDSFLKMNNL